MAAMDFASTVSIGARRNAVVLQRRGDGCLRHTMPDFLQLAWDA
ncbi:MAG: hypothetical protein ACI8UD_002577 [Planctomycetota bacterium]|jgi:hypothetical protein